MFTNLFFTMFVLVILVGVKPFTEPTMQRQEVINELTILFGSYFFFYYTEWVSDY